MGPRQASVGTSSQNVPVSYRMSTSEVAALLATGKPFLRQVMRDNGWWLKPRATVPKSGPKLSQPSSAPPKEWQGWDWLRENETIPGFINWQQRGLWLFGKQVRIEFFTERPAEQRDFRQASLHPAATERCLQYHRMLVGRRSPWIYELLAVGEWQGQLFRVWEKRDEVTSLTRALPLIMAYPHLILRICRDLVEIFRALPETQASFPYAALSWFVLERQHLTLARLPYDHAGNGTGLYHCGAALQLLWDLANRQERLQTILKEQGVRGQDSQNHLGHVLYALLHRSLPYQDHPLFLHPRRILITTRREHYTADRHAHLFAGGSALRNVVLRMAGLTNPYPTIDAALAELVTYLDLDIQRTSDRPGIPWQCSRRRLLPSEGGYS